MLVLLLLHIGRKIFSGFQLQKLIHHCKRVLFKFKYLAPFLLISMMTPIIENDGIENVEFEIINKDKKIGYISIVKSTEGTRTTYEVKSRVETKFILKFKAVGSETSVYQNDTLVYSSMYRKVNRKIKVDQVVEFKNGNYYLNDKKKIELNNPSIIQFNLVQLYFNEPKGITEVYCDKQKKFLKVQSLGNGKYKVQFKKGNYSVFNYRNGECVSIEAIGTFFKVLLEKT